MKNIVNTNKNKKTLPPPPTWVENEEALRIVVNSVDGRNVCEASSEPNRELAASLLKLLRMVTRIPGNYYEEIIRQNWQLKFLN